MDISNEDISNNGVKGQGKLSDQWKQMGNEEKKVAINSEMKRMMSLPANSSYAAHRIKVLNKILHLMSNQVRTPSEDEELVLLFAGLSL